MAQGFTTRVELHHSHTREDYEKLHEAMKVEGFSRTISFEGDSTVYQLPNAEYNRYGQTLTAKQVLASAKKAAASVSKHDASILVTKADGRREISGLQPIKK